MGHMIWNLFAGTTGILAIFFAKHIFAALLLHVHSEQNWKCTFISTQVHLLYDNIQGKTPARYYMYVCRWLLTTQTIKLHTGRLISLPITVTTIMPHPLSTRKGVTLHQLIMYSSGSSKQIAISAPAQPDTLDHGLCTHTTFYCVCFREWSTHTHTHTHTCTHT